MQAYKNYKQARQNIDATILSNAQKYVDKMQTYNKMSNAQEYAYWKSTVKNLKKGSDEYLTAYKSMISAKKAYNQELKDIESEYNEKVKDVYILKNDMLASARPNMKILHPLPRVNEIEYAVDENPHAYYIQQAQNGLYARQAIISDVLGIGLEQITKDKTIIE